MNDLHSRLSALADDLAPDVDPYDQVAGALSLHRRQRRTRLRVAGAALAVAVVAIGVPAAVGTLSAPGDGDTAGPSGSGALRGQADAVRASLAWWEEGGSVPEPEAAADCPDASAPLSDLDGRYAFAATRSNSGGTVAGCGWSTDPSGGTAAEDRIDLGLRAAFDLDADLLTRDLEIDAAQDGCESTTLFPERAPNVLQVCDRGAQQVWTLTVVDEDGTGAWVVTAAVGTDVDARFTISASALGTLWGIVAGADDLEEEPASGDEPEITPMNAEFDEVVDELLDRRRPVLLRAGEQWSCRGGTAELERSLATSLTEGPVDTSLPPQPVCWWTAGPTPTSDSKMVDALSLSIGFAPGAEDVLAGGRTGGSGGTAADGTCLVFEITGDPPEELAEACPLAGAVRYSVTVRDDGGAGVWTFSVQVPPGSAVDPSTATLALVDLADRLW